MSDDIVERLRSPATVFYEYAADNGAFLREAADEITRLRAALAAVIAERDRMREVIKGVNAMLEISCETLERPTYNYLDVGQRHSPLSQKEIIQRLTETCLFVRADLSKLMDEARAAIEGVTEPASPWRDIESAPKDGTSIEVWDESPGAVNPSVVFWENGVWVYADNLLADAAPEGALPSHWRQRSEPPR